MRSPIFGIVVVLVAQGACNRSSAGPGRRVEGQPVETQRPNAPDQKPAFAGQTRAPFQTARAAYDVQVVAKNLEHPWGMAFLPDGAMLVTERPGRLRIVSENGALSPPVTGLPRVDAPDQGGLLDVALDPEFAENQRIFWSYAEPRQGGNGTAVARGRLVREGTPRVENVEVIWRMTPTLDSVMHFGSRLVFSRDGLLFVTTGERSILEGRKQAQDLGSAFGKVIRIDRAGKTPPDNPFVGRAGALPQIWSYGHRNIQSAALHPDTGALWIVEHGAKGGDEINIVEAGKNYGWPIITYGIEYNWDPVIAPSGMAFYEGALFPEWKGNLFVGALAGKHVARLVLDGRRVVGEERLFAERNARIRDVRVGPDGALYVLTDEDKGQLWKVTPKREQPDRSAGVTQPGREAAR